MFNTKIFTYDVSKKCFVAEMSDLGRDYPFVQIYNDACDEGLELVSEITGNVSKWFVNSHEYTGIDDDRELVATVLKPTPESVRKYSALKECTMIIFND